MSALRATVIVTAVLAGAGSLGGCGGASGPKFTTLTAPNDQAVIYVYRPSANFGRMLKFAICLDGDGLPKEAPATCTNLLRNGGYFALAVSPGPHRVWVWKGKDIDVNVEAGKSYYLRFYSSGETFEAIPEDKALPDIRDTHLSLVKQ